MELEPSNVTAIEESSDDEFSLDEDIQPNQVILTAIQSVMLGVSHYVETLAVFPQPKS